MSIILSWTLSPDTSARQSSETGRLQSSSLEFLTSLVAAPSPSGYEQPVARLYRDYTSPFADHVTTDVAGNVMAALNPDAPMKVMLAGHMDEIGFIIHHIGDDGLLYFSAIGGHDSTTPLGQRVWVHGKERLPGVVVGASHQDVPMPTRPSGARAPHRTDET